MGGRRSYARRYFIPTDSQREGHLSGVKRTVSLSSSCWHSNICDILQSINVVHSIMYNKVNQGQGKFREKYNCNFDINAKFLFVYSSVKTKQIVLESSVKAFSTQLFPSKGM